MFKKLNRQSPRLKNFDYSAEGAYFITICTKNREIFFGEICNDEIVLNKSGEILQNVWLNLPKHYPNCFLDEYVIMPNHFHGIIFLRNSVGDGFKPSHKTHSMLEIVRGLKTFSSRKINQNFREGSKPSPTNTKKFRWQRSFYDRVIRNEDELNKIRQYIIMNPANWEKDKNFLSL